MADHFGLDFDLVELLAAVNSNDAANHLGDDDHVSQMGLDQVGLLVGLGVLLCLSQFLDQAHRAALQATVEPSASAGMEDGQKFIGWDVEESVGGEKYTSETVSYPKR